MCHNKIGRTRKVDCCALRKYIRDWEKLPILAKQFMYAGTSQNHRMGGVGRDAAQPPCSSRGRPIAQDHIWLLIKHLQGWRQESWWLITCCPWWMPRNKARALVCWARVNISAGGPFQLNSTGEKKSGVIQQWFLLSLPLHPLGEGSQQDLLRQPACTWAHYNPPGWTQCTQHPPYDGGQHWWPSEGSADLCCSIPQQKDVYDLKTYSLNHRVEKKKSRRVQSTHLFKSFQIVSAGLGSTSAPQRMLFPPYRVQHPSGVTKGRDKPATSTLRSASFVLQC